MRYLFALPLLALLPQDAPKLKERWVAAFYSAEWDAESGEGLTKPGGGDALEDHPESFKDFSYRKVSWHRKNLEQMGEAGIDVALCDFIGRPAAVDALVLALQAVAKERKRIPRIAPVAYDVNAAVAFIGRLPPEFAANVDRKPVVWFPLAKGASPETLAVMRQIVPMFVVGDAAWRPDLEVVSGGAYSGPRDMEAVTLGPGFKDGTSRLRSRDGGVWYERSWYAAMKIKPRIVAIESWNRFDEGSTICPTKEHGKSLVSKTRSFADRFRKGDEIERPKGKYHSAVGVSYHLKFDPPDEGLRPVDAPDAPFEVVTLAGQRILMAKAVQSVEGRALAFEIDDSYAYFERREYEVQVQLMDKGKGQVVLEYDAAAASKDQPDRTRRAAEPFHFTDSGDWAAATFKLPEAAFANRQKGGADFRLVTRARGLSIRWIQVRAK